MKKTFLLLTILLLLPIKVEAAKGCCSRNGGVCGCGANGKVICCNGDYSPSCKCESNYTPQPTPSVVNGCTDPKANNYNPNATNNDGSCTYTIRGCTDSKANNYNEQANENDGTCNYDVLGCMDKKANNYNKKATKDDGSCTYTVKGCTDPEAKNYNEKANKDDKSCLYDPKEEDIILSDLEEEKEKEEKEVKKEEKTVSYEEDNKEDFYETMIGLLTLGGTVTGGLGLYEKKKKKNII